MSELIQKQDNRATIRWKLLTGASALALTAYVSTTMLVKAEDAAQPQIWIELGGQLSRLDDGQEAFAPAFPDSPSRPLIFSPSQKFEGSPLYSLDEFGAISFQPESSDWVFSAAIRYGRSASHRNVRQQTNPPDFVKYAPNYPSEGPVIAHPGAARFADTNARTSERHLILDFQVGKDVGLGIFGKDGLSVVSAGVRFAQFGSKSNISLKSDPDRHFNYKYISHPSLGYSHFKVETGEPFHSNAASIRATRGFHGVGPSISWNASASLMGTPQDSELTFDWGLNAALLFGRQRAKVHHQATGRYHGPKYAKGSQVVVYNPPPVDVQRTKSVTVPNVGGFAGLSFRYADAKLSFGYRADMFFGAMDGGIDTRKNENRAFYGPFASISVGLGD
jgi:iron complex outermembrane receptor protein